MHENNRARNPHQPTKRHKAWLLPLVFLAGYLVGWGSVTVDRQMLIKEQRRLQDDVERARIELRITRMVDEYNEDYTGQVEWNKQAIKPVEAGKWNSPKKK